MARITPDQVRRVASLACLSFEPEELDGMTRDLERILAMVEALQQLDTEGIEPTAHAIAVETPVRDDEAVPAMDPELAVANAPERAGTAFVVPKFVEGAE